MTEELSKKQVLISHNLVHVQDYAIVSRMQ